tara:strand:- start:4861 stop:5655 length:795 start_codon:yes stop_codon:yes gene_type:complete
MVLSLWVIADAVDKLKLSSGHDHTVELTIPTSRLRGTEGRSDNAWLKVCLDRMTGLKIGGTYRGQEWGAVMLAEWRLEEGGTMARLFLPPSAIHALRAGDTFAKIETHAAYRLQGHARTLYGALSDKKRMGNKYWVFELDELRYLLNVGDKKSYKRFNNFRQWVLDPAIEQINDFGTVAVSMTPQKVGRSIVAVRFDWQWKSISDARETDEENERVAMARRKADIVRDMPPLSDDLVDSDRPKPSTEERAAIAKDALKNTPFAR